MDFHYELYKAGIGLCEVHVNNNKKKNKNTKINYPWKCVSELEILKIKFLQ